MIPKNITLKNTECLLHGVHSQCWRQISNYGSVTELLEPAMIHSCEQTDKTVTPKYFLS
jgi:hypothetical protein